MQQLYDNAVDAQKDLGLTFGVSLTPEQQASLTKDMIWLEAQTVAGQHVLVPRVYLAGATRHNTDLNGARLAASITELKARTISNTGRIAGWSGLTVNTSSDFDNFGGSLFSNATVAIRSDSTFDNRSSSVTGEDVSITAAEVINSTAATHDTWFNGTTDRAHQQD